jgi:G8 domain
MSFFSRPTVAARTRKPKSGQRHPRKPSRPNLEMLEHRLMLDATAVANAEHIAVFGISDSNGVVTGGLVPDSSVTVKSIASGNWSNPAIWSTNAVPKSLDNVLVTTNTVVTVDGDETANGALRTIRVDGTLRFNPHANTALLVDSIFVEDGGVYDMGTPTDPSDPNSGPIDSSHRATVTFADLNKTGDDLLAAAYQTLIQKIKSGTPAQIAQATQVFTADQYQVDQYDAARTAWDPLQFSLGLVAHGQVRINGSQLTSFVYAKDMKPGDTTITMGASVPSGFVPGDTSVNPANPVPTGWKVGDQIIITGAEASLPYYLGGAMDQDEEVTITKITGNVITISKPLQYAHNGGANYVSDVSRNVVFASQEPNVDERRGHIMFMHDGDVQIEAAGFYGLGRTDKLRPIDDPVVVTDTDNPGKTTTDVLMANPNPNLIGHTVTLFDGTVIINGIIYANGQPVENVSHRVLAQIFDPGTGRTFLEIARTGLNPRGRYAVHFHRSTFDCTVDAACADDTTLTATIDDSSVVDSPGWGIVNHSSIVDVTNNVVFNATGAAYVTEAGDELGTFDHNIAIKSLGSGEQVSSRQNNNDFGHDGDGFWLQGGNVTLTNNVASGQRHAGFVFFPTGLNQKGLGVTMIPGNELPASYGANPNLMYADNDIPLLQFQGNVAFADQDGYESWFSLQNTKLNVRTVIQDFTVFDMTTDAIFTPYTSLNTLKNVKVSNPVNWAGAYTGPINTAFQRNDLTSNFIYDHVTATNFQVGINAPVVGVNTITGGTFNNLQNIAVTTTNSDTRVLNINDASPSDPVHFLDSLKTTVGGQQVSVKQFDIYLQADWQPLFDDITRNFARDIIKIGLVSHNGQQVYFNEQAFNYVPYPDANFIAANPTTNHGPVAAAWVPAALRNMTNQQLWNTYGIAIGGVVAPMNSVPDPLINGIVGPATTYAPPNYLWSQKWFDDRTGSYYLVYSYWNPALNGGAGGYVYADESRTDSHGKHLFAATPLQGGWNVIQRSFTYTLNGNQVTQPVTLLVYDENQDPTFIQANPGQVLNIADVNNGTVFNLTGWISASYGMVNFTATVKLNDPNYVSAIQTRSDGTQFITISFSITNFAGTTTKISINFNVTTTATLIKDIGQVYLPYVDLSTTLKNLLGM